jgi:formate--tetrahydrofolate ligase
MNKDLLPIEAIVEKLNLPEKYVERLGRYGAKLTLDLLDDPAFPSRGKLILVTATTPTVSGEGKTVTSIGLVQGLEKIGKEAIITAREPSLGPVFGMKGGAAGGGRSQVEPAEKINLHFHGDFHAITSAHNLLSALIDSHLFHGNDLDLDPDAITWPRALDMNDRALRSIIVSAGGKRDGANRSTGFLITAASEIMAIMTLAASREDLRLRLSRIVIGQTRSGKPVLAQDLNATGPMMALLSEAILPNLVQTTEGTPALVHCGPFANIAHGTSSVLSQQMGLRLADYVVNETGFASDLGFEKYMDIVMPSSGIKPAAAVLVTTVQSVRNQGGGDLETGFVAINRFPNDTEEELKFLEEYCEAQGAAFALSEAFAKGGAGATALAEKVVSVIAANPDVKLETTYQPSASPLEKITAVAQKIYGASSVELTPQAEEKLARFTKWGYGELPVCIAKTQYSLTDDPRQMGAPTGWTLHITDVVLSAGAGFLVVISGAMMLMPGLPKASRAMNINVDATGEITGMS